MTGWSLNEVEALARKATRGAGYSWGLADEAGKATRWTCAAGWPGAAALADLLTQTDGVDPADIRPQSIDGHWTARAGLLCPLISGSTICDLAAHWAGGETLTLGPTAQPMLLVPYMVWAADSTEAALSLSWDSLTITRAEGETYVHDPDIARQRASTDHVRLGPATVPAIKPDLGARLTRAYRATVPDETVATLNTLAHRTYAPETEESRRAGAGAGLTDND